jgi:hypothetical protein
MVPVTLELIVSPGAAAAIASRSEPAPLSFVLVTVMVAPKTGNALKTASERKIEKKRSFCLMITSRLIK